jgi:bifunctional DNA-binding transcriptional regulator/antitoxin component of YhaV-PrlF toxin-antitoxin module
MDMNGRVMIPLELRQRAALAPGDDLVVAVEGQGEMLMLTRAAAQRRAQEMAADSFDPSVSLADELFEERRREFERQGRD